MIGLLCFRAAELLVLAAAMTSPCGGPVLFRFGVIRRPVINEVLDAVVQTAFVDALIESVLPEFFFRPPGRVDFRRARYLSLSRFIIWFSIW